MSQHIYTYDPVNGLEEIGGAGHIIEDAAGVTYAKRENLQFEGASVTDDSTNNKTVVTITETNFVGTMAEWNALTADEKAQYKTVDLTDDFNGDPIDATPTSGSTHAVSSGGVYTALAGKQDSLTFDNIPTANSNNPARSGGIYDYIARSASKDVIETIGAKSKTTYVVGDYFLGNDGYFYVATSAITANTTVLNAGTSGNCSKTSVAAKLNSLSTQISNLTSTMSSFSPGGGTLPNGTDLNSIKTPGTYFLASAHTYPNLPSNIDGGLLEVYRSSENVVAQRITNSSTYKMQFRSMLSSTTWSGWEECLIRRPIYSSGNIDTIVETGIYTCDYNVPNLPEASLSDMYVIKRNNGTSSQLIINNNSNMFFRVSYLSGWQGWKKVTTTNFTPS